MKKKLFLLFILLLLSCNSAEEKKLDIFLKKYNIKVPSGSFLIAILPNNSCSSCVNKITNFLNKQNYKKVLVIFLESKTLTMIDRDVLRELKHKMTVEFCSLKDFEKTGLLTKNDNYFKPILIEFGKDKKITYIETNSDYSKYYKILNKYLN